MNKTIFSVTVKDLEGFYPITHTMHFENPPTHTDIAEVLLDFVNPSKRFVSGGVEDRVKEWAKYIGEGKISYYASDVSRVPATWDFGFPPAIGLGDKLVKPFSLTICGGILYAGTPEKKEEATVSETGPKTCKVGK